MASLDRLVTAGQRPWRPAPAAEDVDVWDRFDFPTSGTYRLGDELIVFSLVTTAGDRSMWAYVPVPAERAKAAAEARFDSDAEFYDFVAGFFLAQEVVFAVAEDFIIMVKSDGVPVGTGPHSLLAAATKWYSTRVAALLSHRVEDADAAELLHAAQGVLATVLA